jgi:hypothetical protein
VDNRLIVELKACKTIIDEHVAQTLGYLKAGSIEHGLLINFGSYRFQIKKYAMTAAARPTLVRRLCSFLFSFSAFFAFFRG